MKNTILRIISIILAVLSLTFAFPLSVFASAVSYRNRTLQNAAWSFGFDLVGSEVKSKTAFGIYYTIGSFFGR